MEKKYLYVIYTWRIARFHVWLAELNVTCGVINQWITWLPGLWGVGMMGITAGYSTVMLYDTIFHGGVLGFRTTNHNQQLLVENPGWYIYILYMLCKYSIYIYNHGHAYAIIHTYNPIIIHSNPGSLLGIHGWYPQSLLRNTENDLVFNALENMYPGYCTHSE